VESLRVVGPGKMATVHDNAAQGITMAANASISTILPAGLPMDSQNTALVLSSISPSMASTVSFQAKRQSMPSWGSMCLNSVWVPP